MNLIHRTRTHSPQEFHFPSSGLASPFSRRLLRRSPGVISAGRVAQSADQPPTRQVPRAPLRARHRALLQPSTEPRATTPLTPPEASMEARLMGVHPWVSQVAREPWVRREARLAARGRERAVLAVPRSALPLVAEREAALQIRSPARPRPAATRESSEAEADSPEVRGFRERDPRSRLAQAEAPVSRGARAW
jgi:hypothetical protein